MSPKVGKAPCDCPRDCHSEEVPSDLTARSLAAQQMAWQATTEVQLDPFWTREQKHKGTELDGVRL